MAADGTIFNRHVSAANSPTWSTLPPPFTLTLDTTLSDNEDPDGASGWSIGNVAHKQAIGGSWSDAPGSASIRIAIKGSTAVAANNPATGAPTITGTARVGETLTAVTSGIMDSDGLTTPGYTYQWIRVDGATESDISGATSMTYTLVDADEGKTIKVKVSFTDDGSNSETLTSAATAAVAAANTAPDAPGAPRVAVSATDVRAITVEWDEPANNGAAITDYDVQYQRDDETVWHDAPHTGTGRTVTISNLLLGYGYRVQVRATNSAGTSAWSASGSGATESNTAATGKPTISGTLMVGETLTVDTSGITDADGLSGVSYAYQWRRDGADITGANSMTYTLVDADAGTAISVEVSFTDDGSFDEVLTSDATTTVAAANTPADGRADDHRHGASGGNADGRHVGHHGQRRPDHPRIHVPVDPGGRGHGVRHLGGDVEHLHPGRRRRG